MRALCLRGLRVRALGLPALGASEVPLGPSAGGAGPSAKTGQGTGASASTAVAFARTAEAFGQYAAPVAFAFLSPEWIDAMRQVRAEFSGRERPVPLDLAVNVSITGAPFAESLIRGHVDTSGVLLTLDEGHLEQPDFSIEMPYELALQLFVGRDLSAVTQALFGGAVKLTGDSSKVLLLAGELTPPPPDDPRHDELRALVRRVDEITEPVDSAQLQRS